MSPLQLILLIIVLALIVAAFFVSLQATAPAINVAAIKTYLKGLQIRLANPANVSADNERAKVEILMNKLKTSSSQKNISDDNELKSLIGATCQKIEAIAERSEAEKKTSWHKFKSVTSGFNEFYYHGSFTENIER